MKFRMVCLSATVVVLAGAVPAQRVFVYLQKGQSQQQQAAGTTNTYQHAFAACMDGRGDSVK